MKLKIGDLISELIILENILIKIPSNLEANIWERTVSPLIKRKTEIKQILNNGWTEIVMEEIK
mgnify:CR=1 FL=1